MSQTLDRIRLGWVGLALLALLGTACADKEDPSGTASEARIASFTVEPETVVEGEPALLRWSVSKAKRIFLMADGILVGSDELPAEGELEVRPKKDTTYRLEAQDAKGRSVRKEVTVSVQPVAAPQIVSFEASADTVPPGQPVVLSWKVERALSVRIFERDGVFEERSTEPEGSVEVKPVRTTTYVLEASNSSGTTSASVQIRIGNAPYVVLRFDASEVDFEEKVDLSWEVENAETIEIRDPKGAVLHEGPAVGGSLAVTATVDGEYRATARGAGGETTHVAHLAIRPVVDQFDVVGGERASPGEKVTARWSVRGADSLQLAVGTRWIDLPGLSGELEVEMPAGGVFLLRALRGTRVVEKNFAWERLGEEPIIRVFKGGPLVTAGKGVRGVSSVEWEIDGAAKIRLELVDENRIIDTTGKSPRRDSVQIEFRQPGKVRLTATNKAGSTVAEIPAPVDPVPDIDVFFAAPSRAGAGERVFIKWETTHAARVALEQDGVALGVNPSLVDGAFQTGPITAESTFVLRTYNTLDHEFVSEPLVVPVGPPSILSFDTMDGRRMYPTSATVELRWKNDGGTSLTITDLDTGVVEFSSTDPFVIREGSHQVVLPAQQATKRYELVVTNSSGSDSQILEVMAVTGPVIVEFGTVEDQITVNQTVAFYWRAEPDEDGNLPVLTLVDDLGVEYPMDGVDPLQGTKRFRIENPGDRVFTLTATSPVPPAFSVQTAVKVWDIPVVDHLAATPEFATNEGDPVTVEWITSHDAAYVELYLVDRLTLAPEPSPVYAGPAPSGSATVTPTIAKPHVLLAVYNPLGARTERLLRVGVNPATITRLDVSSFDVLFGEEVTIEWETARATNAQWSESLLDLSTRSTATSAGISGDDPVTNFIFPNGFRFPYDGGSYGGVSVSSNGWLSFTLGISNGSYCCNPTSPLPTSSDIDLAIFWDDLTTPNPNTIRWEYFEDPIPHVIVHWNATSFLSSTRNPSSLTFQAILFEDGRFEYRYGPMTSVGGYAQGQDATIATQNRAHSQANVISHNTTNLDGWSGRALVFGGWNQLLADSTPRPTPLSGSWTLTPYLTRTYTLRAWNGHSEHEEEFEIRVHPRSTLDAWVEPAEPTTGETVVLHWFGKHLTSLVVEDDAGNVVHAAPQSQLESGSFSLGALPPGDHVVRLKGVGQIPRDEHEVEVEFTVQ